MGTLFVVGTPIGNLEDISARAVRTLGSVGLIAAEDTRRTRKLLTHFDLHVPLVSYHAHTPPDRRARLVARLEAVDVALVTDAGTPGVSDPGPALVADALAAGHAVVPVPGPSAVAAALSVSGLPADRFVFLGFLPRRAGERRTALAAVAADPATLVAFEAPQRLAGALSDLAACLGAERRMCVARELTKLHEEVWHGTLGAAAEAWRDREARGEITLVVAGASPVIAETWADAMVRDALVDLRAQGIGAREASRRVAAQSGWAARDVYALWEHEG